MMQRGLIAKMNHLDILILLIYISQIKQHKRTIQKRTTSNLKPFQKCYQVTELSYDNTVSICIHVEAGNYDWISAMTFSTCFSCLLQTLEILLRTPWL